MELPGRGQALRRLALDVAIGYVLAWLVGLAFGYALRATTAWSAGAAWERGMLEWAHSHALPRWLDQVMLATPYVGTNLTILPLILVIGVVLWWRYRQPMVAVQLVVLCVGMLSMNPTMKALLDRPRPALFPLRGLYTWASYPSGHLILVTALYFTIAMFLLRARGWRWPFAAATFILLISAYSRIYLAVHWPTDVIGGVLMGVVWLVTTWRAFARYREAVA